MLTVFSAHPGFVWCKLLLHSRIYLNKFVLERGALVHEVDDLVGNGGVVQALEEEQGCKAGGVADGKIVRPALHGVCGG